MRSLPVQRLTASSFLEVVRDTPWLLVRVDAGLPRLHRGVARFFDSQYPGLFGFGTLPVKETRVHGWWNRNFRTAVGPVTARSGYFLFDQGEVVGHHSGQVRASLRFTDRTSTAEDERRGHAEAEWIRRVAFGEVPVSPGELAAAVELIAYFDGVVFERQQRAGFADGETRAASSRAGAVRAQDVPIPGASGDPFEVLKVAPDASEVEIRAAYKLRMKLNHPDKVAHMSEEIQAYAAAQVRVIKAAWDAIGAVRGGSAEGLEGGPDVGEG